MGGQVSLSIREVDPADYDWTPALEQPMPAPPAAPAEAPLLRPMTESGSWSGPFFEGAALLDAEGEARRPVIIASWSPALASLATGMEWQIRLAGETDVILHGSIQTVAAGRAEISAGILPGASYEARLTPVAPAMRVQASAWEPVTVPDVRLGFPDVQTEIAASLTLLRDWIDGGVTDLPSALTDLLDRLGQTIPRVTSAEQVIEDIALELLGARIEVDFLAQRGVDAGIYVDPESGQVRIAGIETLENRQSAAEIRVDGIAAEIELRATFSYVNQAITDALLDPSQIPIVEGLQLQVSDALLLLDAQTAEIAAKASALVVEGLVASVSQAELDIDALEAEIALRVTSADFDLLGDRVNTAEVQLSALDVPSITFTVQQTRRQTADLDDAALVTLEDLLTGYADRQAIREATASAQIQLKSSVDEALAAEASARIAVDTALGNLASLVATEYYSRSDTDAAIAAATLLLKTTMEGPGGSVGSLAANLSTNYSTTVAVNAAIADALTRLDASYDGSAARGQFRITAEAGPAGAHTRIGLSVAATAAAAAASEASLFIEAISGGRSRILLDGDLVAILNGAGGAEAPFIVTGGEVHLRKAMIKEADIDTLKLAGQSVTIPVAVYQPGSFRPATGDGTYMVGARILSEGYPTVISFGCQMGGSGYSEAEFYLRRNGTIIHSLAAGTGPLGASQSVFTEFVDADPGTGSVAYTVSAVHGVSAVNRGFPSPIISRRSMRLTQTKR